MLRDKPTVESAYYNPILISDCITVSKTIEIPEAEKFNIHFYVEKGTVEINYDSLQNKPSLKLYESARWNARFLQRTINSIHFTGNKFICWIIVERL